MSKRNMSLTHIELQFRENDRDVSACYAVDAQTLRAAQIALGQKNGTMSAAELQKWLDQHGGRLDRPDGPALVWLWADGTKIETWYCSGEKHRVGGPARTTRFVENGTGVVARTITTYYNKGKRHRDYGPARIICYDNGVTVETYYRDDKLIKEDRLVPLSHITGVKVFNPPPKP